MGKLSLLLHLLVSSGQTGVRDEQWGSPEEKKAEMLTGTWLERAKVLAGLFFLLLLLLVLPPPELMVLPPDIFRFLRLLGCCRAGSAVPGKRLRWERALDPVLHSHSSGARVYPALSLVVPGVRNRTEGTSWR